MCVWREEEEVSWGKYKPHSHRPSQPQWEQIQERGFFRLFNNDLLNSLPSDVCYLLFQELGIIQKRKPTIIPVLMVLYSGRLAFQLVYFGCL